MTWGYFENKTEPAVCMQNAVSDDLQYKITVLFMLFHNRQACSISFPVHDTKQEPQNTVKTKNTMTALLTFESVRFLNHS